MGHLYPAIKPYDSQYLAVGQGHTQYVEQSGNPDGIPVVYLHGGPGAGLNTLYRRFFDPQKYRIIGFDQRGCGKSTPFASLQDNSTTHILADMEALRSHLNISRWMLCGGSWGTTLALLYGIAHADKVSAIILRGVFLGRQQDFDWFVDPQGGAAQIFPDFFANFNHQVAQRPAKQSLVDAYYQLFTQADELSRAHAIKAWCLWEERISQMHSTVQEHDLNHDLHHAASLAMLECHYIKHRCFIEENYILDHADKLNGIPGTIIHGRYDLVCKLENAHSLSRVWQDGQLLIVPEAAHSSTDPRIGSAIRQATDAMAVFIKEQSA